MTSLRRSRTFLIGAAVTALALPLAAATSVAGSASAAVGPRPHEVTMYKVEKHVDLSAEYPDNYADEHLTCDPGDIALDGMWRVDHVDQFNPQVDDQDTGYYEDERDVVFYASYSDPNDARTWRYRFENLADTNAQVKLFLTCIRGKTEANAGHKHAISVTTPNVYHYGAVAAGQPEFSQTQCGPHQYAVAPGFNFADDDHNHIFRSWPTADGRGWNWAFTVDDSAHPGAVQLDVAFRCLSDRVAPWGSPKAHTHQLPMTWRPNTGLATTYLSDYGKQERQLSCDDAPDGAKYQDYKAMVGAFYIADPNHAWFLGMDPRPKTRAYSFFWDGSGANTTYVGALCVRSKTGKQIKP